MISKFDGPHRWLSNFYPAEVQLDGITYPSVEHAYQAAKSLDSAIRKKMCSGTAAEAKQFGRVIPIRKDWDAVKLDVMLQLLRSKFKNNSSLAFMLLATEERPLVEGNWWHDYYWGVCHGRGENHLGRLLMQVRSELRSRTDGVCENAGQARLVVQRTA